MTRRIDSVNLCQEVCRLIRITRQNEQARQLSKRELLHLVAWIRLNTDKMTDMERRIVTLEKGSRNQ